MFKRGLIGGIVFLFLFSGIVFALEKDYEIALTKGTYQIETGEYQEAIVNLRKALEIKPNDLQATIVLGIAYSQSGDYEKAREVLQKALKIDPANERAQYELGVVLYRLGEGEKAGEYFLQLKDSKAKDPVKKAAVSYIEIMASKRRDDKKRFSLGALVGGQYDTNVILEPSDPDLSREHPEDWRALFVLDADWIFLKKVKSRAVLGYLFYQSLHEHNTDFNIHQHNPGLSWQYIFDQTIDLELGYSFHYTLAGGEEYSSIHDLGARSEKIFSDNVAAELHYAHEFKTYYDSDAFPDNDDRSGNNDAAGLTGRMKLSDAVKLSLDYTFDTDSTNTDYWDYNGHKGTLAMDAKLKKWFILLEASYYDQQYLSEIPGTGEKRHDQVQEYSINLVWELDGHFSLNASEVYVINGSNLELFDYDRSITGLYLMGRL